MERLFNKETVEKGESAWFSHPVNGVSKNRSRMFFFSLNVTTNFFSTAASDACEVTSK